MISETPKGILNPEKPTDPGGVLLSCAGCLVVVATFTAALMWASIIRSDPTGHEWGAWGQRIFVPLTMMLIAMVLGCVAIFQPCKTRNESSAPRATLMPWLAFTALLVVHVGFALLYFGQGHDPLIDTFTFQRDACGSLLRGENPFGTTQANVFDPYHTALFYGEGMVVNGRVQVGFQYPPLTLLWVMPGYLLGGVRYSYILAVIVTALFWFLLCPTTRGLWLVAALFLSPVTFLVEYLCWTEPLVLMTLSVSVYAAVKKKWWLPIALGIFLGSKQYNFLALPLIGLLIRPFNWKEYWKLTGQSVGVAVLTVLPFALWNFRGLWHDLVLFHLAQPFRSDAISFAVPFPWMLKVGPLLVVALIVSAVRAAKPRPAIFTATYSLSLLLFVCTNKQAFMNYYFLIGNTFLLAVAALPQCATKPDHEPA
jgi:hypothetical protein